MSPEENARIWIITIKDAHIESLEIEGFRQKPFIIRNLKKCQIHYQVAYGKEIIINF